MSGRKRGPYKRYLTEPSRRIPRQTRYNWRVRSRILSSTHDSIDRSQEVHDHEDDGPCEDQGVPEDAGSESDRVEVEEGGADRSPSHLLYPGAKISEDIGVALLLSMATKHKTSFSALADILKVLCMHFPAGTPVPTAYKSVYRLLKKVATLGNDMSTTTVTHR